MNRRAYAQEIVDHAEAARFHSSKLLELVDIPEEEEEKAPAPLLDGICPRCGEKVVPLSEIQIDLRTAEAQAAEEAQSHDFGYPGRYGFVANVAATAARNLACHTGTCLPGYPESPQGEDHGESNQQQSLSPSQRLA